MTENSITPSVIVLYHILRLTMMEWLTATKRQKIATG
jgi:hypothetical protein